jgi:hypothetical protein
MTQVIANQTETEKKTIVCFKIGRGGHYWNPGYISYDGKGCINNYIGDLFDSYENQYDILKKIGSRENLKSKYYECCDNDDFSFFEKLGFDLGEKIYCTCNGNPVGLSVDNDGTGEIDIDRGYDTTYCKFISDCNNDELKLIIKYEHRDICEMLKEAGYKNVEIFEAFGLLSKMIEYGDGLSYHGIVEVGEEDAELEDVKLVCGKYYQY